MLKRLFSLLACGLVIVLLSSCGEDPAKTQQRLFTACLSGSPTDVRKALTNGADVKARTASGDTALIFAGKAVSNPAVRAFLRWMQGLQGQELVEKFGYVGN